MANVQKFIRINATCDFFSITGEEVKQSSAPKRLAEIRDMYMFGVRHQAKKKAYADGNEYAVRTIDHKSSSLAYKDYTGLKIELEVVEKIVPRKSRKRNTLTYVSI